MAAVLALAMTLNTWNLSASGYGNLYYTAAVRSMAQSWHNFFFVSYDPGGFISIDKPPVAFWAQVLSVKLFGFSGFSVLLPEVIAGGLSTLALWRIVRHAFGRVAGVLAALALALSPINVIVNRDNVTESLLTLTLLLAAAAVCKAAERGSLRWLLASAALMGLGFNIKMLEAYLIVPALVVVYLLGARGRLLLRAKHLALAGVVMLALSFVWILAVDMTPASQRPYVGSTTTNSEMELALSYNGAGRLLGGMKPSLAPHALTKAPIISHAPVVGSAPTPHHGPLPGDLPSVGRGHGASPDAKGAPGPWRLFQSSLGSQVGWLLPMALTGLGLLAITAMLSLVGARRDWRRRLATLRLSPRAHGALLWGTWLATQVICFSFARSINAYYVAILGPAVCALAAIAAADFLRAARAGQWRALVLPLALLATIAQQAVYLTAAPQWRPGLALALGLAALALAAALYLTYAWAAFDVWQAQRNQLSRRLAPFASSLVSPLATTLTAAALALALIAPTGWTLSSLTWGNAGGWPSVGPQFAQATPDQSRMVDRYMTSYLYAHRGEDRFIVGALNSYITAPLIVATGAPVLDMGGFAGNDHILTDRALERLVQEDQVHLFLLPSTNVTSAQRARLFGDTARPSGGAPTSHEPRTQALIAPPVSYTNSLTRWISQHCEPVPPAEWSSAGDASHRLGAWELFSCQS